MPRNSPAGRSIVLSGSIFATLLIVLFSLTDIARAEDDFDPRIALSEWEVTAERVQDLLKTADVDAEKLEDDYLERLLAIAVAANALAAEKAAELEPLASQRSALSGPEELGPENARLIREREKLDRQIADITAIRNRADREAKRVEALVLAIATARRSSFRSSLLVKGPSPANPNAWLSLWTSLTNTVGNVRRGLANINANSDNPFEAWSYALIGILAALIIGIVIQRRVDHSMRRFYKRKPANRKRRFIYAILFTIQRVVLLLAAVLVGTILVNVGVEFGEEHAEAFAVIPVALAIMIFFYVLVQTVFSPDDETLRIVEFDSALAHALARNILFVIAILTVNSIVVDAGELENWPLDALAAANFLAVLLASLIFYRIARIASHPSSSSLAGPTAPDSGDEDPDDDASDDGGDTPDFRRLLGILALLAGLAALVTSLLGYFALSRYFLTGVIGSGATVGVSLVLYSAFNQIGAFAFGQPVPEDDCDPQVPWWFSLSSGLVLIVFALPFLALIWGASPNDITLASTRLLEGAEVGGVRLAPTHFLIAILVFLALVVATRFAKRYLARKILPRTSLDTGARNSIVAGAGYVGVTFAILVALSVAGLDLSKLALVAGALSVGIGFGLQNIVGNFVSGLILLIERPIKNGDWVVVGGRHGTVRRIDVRATQIDTFDRSTLIVPNTELITSTVENWTHRNSIGRVIVPIRVAYGTDPLKVQRILEEIAEENSTILPRPAPQALFRGFGESALNFELRGFLRDINNIFIVENEVCLAIDKRFREAGIEIPFPQHVVHMRSPEKPDSPGQSVSGNDAGAAEKA